MENQAPSFTELNAAGRHSPEVAILESSFPGICKPWKMESFMLSKAI